MAYNYLFKQQKSKKEKKNIIPKTKRKKIIMKMGQKK